MKNLQTTTLLLSVLIMLASCGKPNDPESMYPGDSGNYKIISKFQTTGYTQDVVVKDTLCYITQGEGGLMIVDVKDVENPEMVSITTENVRGYSSKIAMKDDAIYIAAGSFGVTVIEVDNPVEPNVSVSNLSMKPAKDFHVVGDYLFTSISEQGVKIAEIGYPSQPDIRGDIKTPGYARGLTTTADTSFLLIACGEMGLSIYNITDFQNGFGGYPQTAWFDTPGYAEAIEVSRTASIAYLACGTAGLQVVDFSDSTNVHIIGTYDGAGYAKELLLEGDKIYMTAEKGGLQVIDVADPTKPSLIGSVSTEYALGVAASATHLFVTDEEEGLIVISKPTE